MATLFSVILLVFLAYFFVSQAHTCPYSYMVCERIRVGA